MTMPFNEILLALKAGVALRFKGRAFGGKEVTVRHGRHRDATSDQRPCISIVYASNGPSGEFGRNENDLNMPEQVNQLDVDFVIDCDLPPEADEFSETDPDPTGWGTHAEILTWLLDWLFPNENEPENTLGGLAWMLRYDGTSPDTSDASPDEARLEERLAIFYRVRADRPTILLRGV